MSAPTRTRESLERPAIFRRRDIPIPNRESWQAAEAILACLKTCDERTLVFFLLSGGGSALVELPLDSKQTLEDVQQLYRALVTCGAPIGDIGTVRRHLSAVKGGRLAAGRGAATKITLAVSDVPAKQEAALASGPTLPDPTTIADVRQVLMRIRFADATADGRAPVDRRRKDDRDAQGRRSGVCERALFAAAGHGRSVSSGTPRGGGRRDASRAATTRRTIGRWRKLRTFLLGQLEELRATHPGRRVALIADGEVSSPVTGNGIGGRNSAFVLACVEKIAGRRLAVLSAGTDGIDGNSPAAGAVADGETLGARAIDGDGPGTMRSGAATLTTFLRSAGGCRRYRTHGKQFARPSNPDRGAVSSRASMRGPRFFGVFGGGRRASMDFSRSLISCTSCSSCSRRCETEVWLPPLPVFRLLRPAFHRRFRGDPSSLLPWGLCSFSICSLISGTISMLRSSRLQQSLQRRDRAGVSAISQVPRSPPSEP